MERNEQGRRGCDEQRRVRVCERSGDRRGLERCRTCGDSTGKGRDGGKSDEWKRRKSVVCSMIEVSKDPRTDGKTVVAPPFLRATKLQRREREMMRVKKQKESERE